MQREPRWACPNYPAHGERAVCDVTTARAPQGQHECRSCLRALDKTRPVFPRQQGGGSSLRIYRGLKEPYDPTRVGSDRLSCSNFTDSAFWALQYASARRGVVLVVDVPVDSARVSEKLWLERSAKRYGVWGRFDEYIVAQIPAKELRAEVRRKGLVTLGVVDKAQVLAQHVARQLSTGHSRNNSLTRH